MRAACWLLAVSLCACQVVSRGPAASPDAPTARRTFVPPSSYEAYVRGELLLEQGHYREAADALLRATAAPDEDAYLLSRLAWAQALAGQRDAAATTLEEASRVDACSEAVAMVRGRLAERAQDLAAAVRAYAQAVSCAPQASAPALALAHALEQQGRRQEAKAVLRANGQAASAEALLALALLDEDTAAVATALELLSNQHAPGSALLARAIEQALRAGRPLLALRYIGAAPASLPTALVARSLLAAGEAEQARTLLDHTADADLGSASEAAVLLLAAGLPERAELATLGPARDHEERVAQTLQRARAIAAQGRIAEAARLLAGLGTCPAARDVIEELAQRAGVPAGLWAGAAD